MLVVADPTTAFLDQFTTATTLILISNIRDPVTGQPYSRDARYVAQKAETYLKSTGIGEAAHFGPDAEFFVFNEVRYGQGINYAMHEIDSIERTQNTGTKEEPNSLTSRGRKRDIFQFLRSTVCRICAPRSATKPKPMPRTIWPASHPAMRPITRMIRRLSPDIDGSSRM